MHEVELIGLFFFLMHHESLNGHAAPGPGGLIPISKYRAWLSESILFISYSSSCTISVRSSIHHTEHLSLLAPARLHF